MKVAIDAGHGYSTPGKRTPDGYREHTINVTCAEACDLYLKRMGIETVRIGWDDGNATNDADMALSKRQKLVKNTGCDISISFHANAHGNGNGYTEANGVETLIHDKYPGDSARLASCVQKHLLEGTAQRNRGVKQQALSICNTKTMGTKASVLVEVGFMTNRWESQLMKTMDFCKEQGEDAAKGILEYLGVDKTVEKETHGIAYQVRVTAMSLNVRSGPGTNYKITTSIKKGGVYTILEEKNGWGKLKSGAGWICMKYAERI